MSNEHDMLKVQQPVIPSVSMLDTGSLPVEELSKLTLREGPRPRQIYQAHRWFARRSGTAFRALLTGAALPPDADFWKAYYEGVDLSGLTLLDPFVGGGTSVVEAQRLGANIIGVDVDAVACAITRFETHAANVPDLTTALDKLKSDVGKLLAPYYLTQTPNGEEREVLHYFWVQVVKCHHCGQTVEAHPHYQLAYEAGGTHQWVFCKNCHNVQELDLSAESLHCKHCGVTTVIKNGPIHYGRFTCPYCKTQERLIDLARRTGQPPQWKMFAIEYLDMSPTKGKLPLSHRRFRAVSKYDDSVLKAAKEALKQRELPGGSFAWVPDRHIPRKNRADDRLIQYGYSMYRELFNPRQLLHLSYLAEAINGLPESVHEAMALAFSDHLTTNCMMAHYAFGWRRLAPLFSLRAYRHVTRPVEINPWLDGVGRGTFPNTVRQAMGAVAFARAPKEPTLTGGFIPSPPRTGPRGTPSVQIFHGNSKHLDFIQDATVDLVLTDPPYFDNIAYSELSDFYLPWLQLFNLVPLNAEVEKAWTENLAAKKRVKIDLEVYQESLGKCFMEIARVLKPEGRLVFTYQHATAEAWNALAYAFMDKGLRPIQVFPLLGDGNTSLHTHKGSSKWDIVFVLKKEETYHLPAPLTIPEAAISLAHAHYHKWAQILSGFSRPPFRQADHRNLYRGCLVAAALGIFPDSTNNPGVPKALIELLREEPPEIRFPGREVMTNAAGE